VLSYPVFRILCIFYAPLLVMIFLIFSSYPYSFMHIVKIYLEGLGSQGQTRLHLGFLNCFPYISLVCMGAHFVIKKVATPHLPPTRLRIIRTRIPTHLLYYYSSSLSMSSQYPMELPSISQIRIDHALAFTYSNIFTLVL